MNKGKFITIEGVEGVGKSTNIEFIRRCIEKRGIDVVVTREPGGTPLAEELRAILLTKREEAFDPLAELLVIFAARAQHLRTFILPQLEGGRWVISDRFTDATYAYQGFGRGLSIADIKLLESLVQNSVHPDKTFMLDIDVRVGMQRVVKRAELDRFEEEKITFFERVRQGYQQRVLDDPHRYSVIDAGQALDVVQTNIEIEIEQFFAELKPKNRS